MPSKEHDVDDEEKVNRVYELLEDDEWDELLTDFERRFIYDNYQKFQVTDFIPSTPQSITIDEIYEKCYRKGCFD